MSPDPRFLLTYVIDTNVVSELRKQGVGRADPGVVAWASGVNQAELFISAITILELETGVLLMQRRDARQGAMLRAWLDSQVVPSFEGRVLPVNAAIAKRGAALNVPVTRPGRDALIAATALVHRMTVVTRNEADFAPMGVKLLNPWSEPAARDPSA